MDGEISLFIGKPLIKLINLFYKYYCQTPTRLGTQPEWTWSDLNKSGSELTLFSHVTRTRRTTRRRTSPNFTVQEGSICLYLREGERVTVRKVSGGCLEGVWKVSGRCLEGVNFLGPNFFWKHSNFFRTQNSSWLKIFGTQIFSGR